MRMMETTTTGARSGESLRQTMATEVGMGKGVDVASVDRNINRKETKTNSKRQGIKSSRASNKVNSNGNSNSKANSNS